MLRSFKHSSYLFIPMVFHWLQLFVLSKSKDANTRFRHAIESSRAKNSDEVNCSLIEGSNGAQQRGSANPLKKPRKPQSWFASTQLGQNKQFSRSLA